jgi:hypothetical protein
VTVEVEWGIHHGGSGGRVGSIAVIEGRRFQSTNGDGLSEVST